MSYGTLPDGTPIDRLQIGSDGLQVSLLTLGAALQELRLAGVDRNLTLGFPTLEPYLGAFPHAGTIMGPVANRIGGARTVIDGAEHRFDANFLDQHTLHGGRAATHLQVWSVARHDSSSATLTLDLPDGAGGFPGNRRLTAGFSVAGAALTLRLQATTDAATLINLANHSYWNLGPEPTTRGHLLQVDASDYTPTGDDLIPSGEIAPVAGSRFDFRAGREIEAGAEGLLDTNLCLSHTREALRRVARLTGPTGVTMDVATTEPGLQIFDGHILGAEAATTTDGRASRAYAAFALEAQCWPDAPNHADFPDITLRPGETYEQITRWSFSV